MKVTAVELSDAEIANIMRRAVGACAYWAENGANYITNVDDDIIALCLHHEKGQAVLDVAAINRGVCLALTKTTWPKGAKENLGFIDLVCVDAIVQYGLFGKLVYG